MKKILVLFLTAIMLFALGATLAFAQETETTESTSETKMVAQVGDTQYATIDEAIANWTANTTLTLLSDVTLTDTITLNSTEHHILNLSTYTMTAASGKNAIVIKACGVGSAERSALTINADANNPGGINAGSKSVVYYKYDDGGISTDDRPIITVNGGVFKGSTSSFGTAGFYVVGSKSKEARKTATLKFTGGTFNCSINGTTKSKLLISGGTFNYSVGSQGDSTAIRLIYGGRFKSLGFMTADSNNTKFWFGTSMANSNVGVYIDKEGYLVVGGAPITEAGDRFVASSTNYSGFSSLLQYSSAKTYGLFYETIDEAFADNNKTSGVVTVYTDVIVMTDRTYKGTINVSSEIEEFIVAYPQDKAVTWKVTSDGKIMKYTEMVMFDSTGTIVRNYSSYNSLQEAIDASNSGDTIKLDDNVTLDTTLVIAKDVSITLDLNGHNITSNNDNYAIDVKGELTLDGTGTVTGGACVNEGASLTINNGKLCTTETAQGSALSVNGGTVVINNGEIANGSTQESTYAVSATNNSNVTINNGTFNGDIYSDDSTYEISGGTYTNKLEKEWLADGYACLGNDSGTYDTVVATKLVDVFTFKGYSINTDGVGITASYTVDHELLARYCEENDVTATLGVAFGVEELNANSVYDSMASLRPTTNYNLILKNISEANYNTNVVMALYVEINNEKKFVTGVNGETAVVEMAEVKAISYNSVKEENN